MPNRAKRAAARQTQLGQRRRKERKDRTPPVHSEDTITTLGGTTSTDIVSGATSEMQQVVPTTEPAAAKSTAGVVPSQPYLRSDLTRIGIVTLISATIVVGSAFLL